MDMTINRGGGEKGLTQNTLKRMTNIIYLFTAPLSCRNALKPSFYRYVCKIGVGGGRAVCGHVRKKYFFSAVSKQSTQRKAFQLKQGKELC